MTLEKANTESKMYLSKDSSGSEFSLDGNFYFTSVGSSGSPLCSNLKKKYFAEARLLTR